MQKSRSKTRGQAYNSPAICDAPLPSIDNFFPLNSSIASASAWAVFSSAQEPLFVKNNAVHITAANPCHGRAARLTL